MFSNAQYGVANAKQWTLINHLTVEETITVILLQTCSHSLPISVFDNVDLSTIAAAIAAAIGVSSTSNSQNLVFLEKSAKLKNLQILQMHLQRSANFVDFSRYLA